MAKAEIRDELFFRAPTRVGLLADVAEAISAAGVNMTAIGAYERGDVGEFLILTDDNRAAGEALMGLEGEVDLAPVVIVEVPNKPGELAAVVRKVADAGINMTQVHGTTSSSDPAMIVINADQPAKLIDVLA